MLFLTFKNGTTQRLVVDGGVTCEEARALVAEWVGVEAQHVYLWWTAQTDLFGSFPDDVRLLQDDDQTVYHVGAIYFGVGNELGDEGAEHASMPWLGRFVRFGAAPPVLAPVNVSNNVSNNVSPGFVWREIANPSTERAGNFEAVQYDAWITERIGLMPSNPNLPRIQDSLLDVGYDYHSDSDMEQVD